MKAFELKFRLRPDHPSAQGTEHSMAFEAESEEWLRGSIDPQFEIISCTEIPHPGQGPSLEDSLFGDG